jgi:DNA-binding MarR family transcriptional regulator
VHDTPADPTPSDPTTGERPTDDPPQRRISLPFDIFELSTRLGTYLGRALEGTGVRPAEYAVYSLMLEAGPRTPSELAAMLGMPLSTMSTYLSAMLGRGDAKRIPNPSDGRSVRVVLTDRGRGVVRKVNPPFTRAVVALEANLDAPVGDVRAALRGVLEAIERADAELASERRDPEADTTSS